MEILKDEPKTKEGFLNSFDEVVGKKGGIPRDIWEDKNEDKKKSTLLNEIANLPKKVEYEKLGNGRIKLPCGDIIDDLTGLDFITVDPEGCMDMDDAVCCYFNEKDNTYTIYTAVADVPRYFDLPEKVDSIPNRSTIGEVYLSGQYTMYSPFKAYGILPEKLEHDLCSLKAGEDRLAFVVKMVIDGKSGCPVGEAEFFEGLIKSRGKLTYSEAQNIVDKYNEMIAKQESTNDYVDIPPFTDIEEQVVGCNLAGKCIRKGYFKERGMINFPDEKERKIEIEDEKIVVKTLERIPYQDVIEAFMILTNEASAQFAQKKELNVIYRTHSEPNINDAPQQIRAFQEYMKLPISEEETLTPEFYNNIFNNTSDSREIKAYKRLLVRLQCRAQSETTYSQGTLSNGYDERGGEYTYSHFGLQSEAYLHITSPIRRATDYINMKNILACIQDKQPISGKMVEEVARLSNIRAGQTDKASAEFMEILANDYYKDLGLIHASICDFDYTDKNGGGVAIFEDEKTGFKIKVLLEKLVPNYNKCTQSFKWGVVTNNEVAVLLGQEKNLSVEIENDQIKAEPLETAKSLGNGKEAVDHHSSGKTRTSERRDQNLKYKSNQQNGEKSNHGSKSSKNGKPNKQSCNEDVDINSYNMDDYYAYLEEMKEK